MIKPQIPSGFWELSLEKQNVFKNMLSTIEKVYERNCFMQMDTPVMEYKEVLLAKSQGETSKQIFEIAKGDKAYVMRYDLTVPLARFVAEHYNEIKFPFKRYQIGKVYRGERPQKGRYREFYQADIDVIGNGKLSIRYDAYVIATISEALSSLGLNKYVIALNNRKVIQGLVAYLGIDNPEALFILIDKYDKLTRKQFEEELIGLVSKSQAQELIKVLDMEGNIISQLKALRIENPLFQEGLCELEEVIGLLETLGVSKDNYTINLKIIRGLDYYTGTIFETFLVGNERYGSIASGGRYANLASAYINRNLPGVGGSIGVSRLFSILDEIGFFEEQGTLRGAEADYLIVPVGNTLKYAIKVQQLLKKKASKVDIYLEKIKPDKAIRYCMAREIPNIVFIGDEEVRSKVFKVKNLESRQEYIISMTEGIRSIE